MIRLLLENLRQRRRERQYSAIAIVDAVANLQARPPVTREQEQEDFDITEAMLRMGGSFVQALAVAFRAADRANHARLKHAFPEYWTKYRDLARLRKQQAPPAPSDPRD